MEVNSKKVNGAKVIGPAEILAKKFHETYERLAPLFGYKTREAPAVQWEHVPQQNRALMIAVCAKLLKEAEAEPWRR